MNCSSPIGESIKAYYFGNDESPIEVFSEGFDTDTISPQTFFANYKEMPKLEQLAMQKAKGKILDIGACAGRHSLHLQEQGKDVTALERCCSCVEVLNARGVKKVLHKDLFDLEPSNYDTLLLLMNGSGIAGTLSNLPHFLTHLKSLLSHNGRIIMDSSDLIYLEEEEDGSFYIDIANKHYYGELIYETAYKGVRSKPFPWLYIDSQLLTQYLELAQLEIEEIHHGEHYDYLAIIKHKS